MLRGITVLRGRERQGQSMARTAGGGHRGAEPIAVALENPERASVADRHSYDELSVLPVHGQDNRTQVIRMKLDREHAERRRGCGGALISGGIADSPAGVGRGGAIAFRGLEAERRQGREHLLRR